ncbi:DUF6817 domain-containing protein [Streptomyces morookaense]|uniref:DUF6817 domain-containing protein n=1 Tax=Streptomyces morookaense TaxID=1970 RepID=A0A7Y7BB64_STRMO|nr:hypothetical protein [Streptomyces morookaense]NVK82179.1 hypothetical protein [Streptomyces morookaense]GHF46348.1 hypothetical protein GCM10010359_56040 [Streptomyces morookaense]
MSAPPAATDQALTLIRRLGAESVAHPGGTLMAHLRRVQARLAAWNARPALQLAGLCHALYGTDGFPATLLPPNRRTDLTAAIGAEAEAVVYVYAACDRKLTYPALARDAAAFHDRFTGRTRVLEPQECRDFAELSAANELDIAQADPAFREKWGPELLALFARLKGQLSADAWRDCRTVLET